MARISSAALRRNEGQLFSLVEKNCLLGMWPDSISFIWGGAEATEDLADCSLPCRRSTYWMSKTSGRRFGMRPQTPTSGIEFDT